MGFAAHVRRAPTLSMEFGDAGLLDFLVAPLRLAEGRDVKLGAGAASAGAERSAHDALLLEYSFARRRGTAYRVAMAWQRVPTKVRH